MDLVGYTHVGETFAKARAESQLGSAYCITGPLHVGKTTLMRELMRQLLCAHAGNCAPLCQQCHALKQGIHPDAVLVDPDEGAELVIESIRAIERVAHTIPTHGSFTVIGIAHSERMNHHAANALLKTLEDPPPHAIFLMSAERHAALLPTLRSRMQRIVCAPLHEDAITEGLCARGVAAKRAREIAALSRGRFGIAWTLACDDHALLETQRTSQAWSDFFDRPNEHLATMTAMAGETKESVEIALTHARIVARERLCALLEEQGSNTQTGRMARFLRETNRALLLLSSTNTTPRLIYENILLCIE